MLNSALVRVHTEQTKDSLVSFETIRQQLTKVSGLDQFKNTIIVGLVLIRRKQDNAITNFYDPYTRSKYDEKQDFDQYFIGITPNLPSNIKNRKPKPWFVSTRNKTQIINTKFLYLAYLIKDIKVLIYGGYYF